MTDAFDDNVITSVHVNTVSVIPNMSSPLTNFAVNEYWSYMYLKKYIIFYLPKSLYLLTKQRLILRTGPQVGI